MLSKRFIPVIRVPNQISHSSKRIDTPIMNYYIELNGTSCSCRSSAGRQPVTAARAPRWRGRRPGAGAAATGHRRLAAGVGQAAPVEAHARAGASGTAQRWARHVADLRLGLSARFIKN